MTGLQNLATMARGSLYHVAGTGETIFDRLASEISAYYLLGVEQKANDREGTRRRIDVEVGRRGAIIRSRQAFVLVRRHAQTAIHGERTCAKRCHRRFRFPACHCGRRRLRNRIPRAARCG
jgi:hypothetical protein